MGIKWHTKFDKLPKMTATTKAISNRKVKVGALTGKHAWLAAVHENGAEIRATKAKYLTVPINPKAKGKKAGSFSDLFVFKSEDGELFLAQQKRKRFLFGNKGKDELELMYWLTKSVKIPKRPFLSTGHDKNASRILKQTERALSQVVAGKMTVNTLLDLYGHQMASAIKLYIRDLNSPPNSSITEEVKGSDNPLKDTGGLIESITWKKE